MPWFPLLLLAAPPPGAALPEQTRDGMTARLTVHVADAGPQPGAALVLLTLQVTGGPRLEVEPATLADPTDAWEARRNEWCRLNDGRVTWTQAIRLTQKKPGPAALPDVTVRFRDGPAAAWRAAEWVDLLKTARDSLSPERAPAAPPASVWAAWAGLTAALLALAALVWGWRRRRSPRPAPPDRQALLELRRLEKSALTDLDSPSYHTALSDVVRRYVADRFGWPATRQTTAEFVAGAARTGRLSSDQQASLRDLLERCDLAKFAPAGAAPEDRRHTAALARAFVEETAARHNCFQGQEAVAAREGASRRPKGESVPMSPNSFLEHVVGGVAGAQHHWQTRRREAAETPGPAFTIAIAREVGASGSSVAAELGRRLLGWQVYDHELLERIAAEHGLRVSLLESLDERRQSWLVECMEAFSQQAHVGESGYVRHLTQTILSLGAHGNCVIVGRGAGHLLPRATTLRVRLIGDLTDRVAAAMRQRGLSRHDAAAWVEKADRDRVAFIKDHFHRDPTDPHHYDLILNSSRWSMMECADLILDGLGRLTRHPLRRAAAPDDGIPAP